MNPQSSIFHLPVRTLLLVVLSALPPGAARCAEPAGKEEVVFEDHFDQDLGEGWGWLREQGAHWCVREQALEIRVTPGFADTVRNALLRDAPDRRLGAFAIEVTVTSLAEPTEQYEQAGLTWYQDGKPVFKFVKELVDGELMMIPGRKPLASRSVQLRLVVTADSYVAQYRAEGKGEFQIADRGALPAPGKDQISVQCYHGPADREHWIRFDDFRIVKLDSSE